MAVPTTAGTGAQTNPFGVVTDPAACRTFYVGHPGTMPAAAILDPALTVSLSPAVTATTGMDALTHALESYLSLCPNPWSVGIAFALGVGDTHQTEDRNAAAIDAVAALRDRVGLTALIGDFGITEANSPRSPPTS